MLLACGMLFGPWLGAVYGAIGGLIGGALIFGIARAFGRDAVQSRIGGALRVFDELLATPRRALARALHRRADHAAHARLRERGGIPHAARAVLGGDRGRAAAALGRLHVLRVGALLDPSFANVAVAGGIIAAAIAITWRLRNSFRAP